jgi:tetratricopeptide (TPR) repeat protein
MRRFALHPRWRVLFFICWLTTALPSASPAAEPSDSFAAAAEAFAAADYLRALALFQRALAAGAQGAAVHYNIGVCQYKLGDFAEAEVTFRDIAEQFPEMRDVAEYNLGLALLAQGRSAEAREEFARVGRSNDPALAELARRALGPSADEAAAAWLGSVDVGLGYDDNVALIDEASIPTGQSTESAFMEVFAYANRSGARPWLLDLSLYDVRYAKAEEFDQTAVRVGGTGEWRLGAWRFAAGPHYTHSTLDGTGFERHVGVGIETSRSLGAQSTFFGRLVHEDVEELSPEFAFVNGSRQLWLLAIEHDGGRGTWRLSYEHESNDRQGSTVTADRNRVLVRRSQRVNDNWNLTLGGAYRNSEHEQLSTDSDETLLELSATARRELPAGWLLQTELYIADNDSDDALFAYDRRRVSLGVNKAF